MKNLRRCVIRKSVLILFMGVLSNLGVDAAEKKESFSVATCVNAAMFELLKAETLKKSPKEGQNASDYSILPLNQ